MEKFLIYGGTHLKGEVSVGGAKNAALPIIAGTLLVKGITTLTNVPNISDIENICEILECLGVKVKKLDTNTKKHDYDEIISLKESGLKPKEISEKLDIPLRTVYYILNKK